MSWTFYPGFSWSSKAFFCTKPFKALLQEDLRDILPIILSLKGKWFPFLSSVTLTSQIHSLELTIHLSSGTLFKTSCPSPFKLAAINFYPSAYLPSPKLRHLSSPSFFCTLKRIGFWLAPTARIRLWSAGTAVVWNCWNQNVLLLIPPFWLSHISSQFFSV